MDNLLTHAATSNGMCVSKEHVLHGPSRTAIRRRPIDAVPGHAARTQKEDNREWMALLNSTRTMGGERIAARVIENPSVESNARRASLVPCPPPPSNWMGADVERRARATPPIGLEWTRQMDPLVSSHPGTSKGRLRWAWDAPLPLPTGRTEIHARVNGTAWWWTSPCQ